MIQRHKLLLELTVGADPGEIPDFNKTGLLPEVTFIHKVGLCACCSLREESLTSLT